MTKPDSLKALVLFFFLWLPSLTVLTTGHAQDHGERFAILGFSLFVLLCPLLLLPRLRWYFLLWTPLALLIPPWVYLTLLYASVPGDALVAAALFTNPVQSAEVLRGFGWKLAIVPLSAIAYFIIACSLDPALRLTNPGRKKLLAGLLMYAMLGMLGRQALAQVIKTPPLFEEYTATLTFPSNLALSITRVLGQERRLSLADSVNGRQRDGATRPVLVVLVIGESVRSDHLGINGYARNTTPGLAALGPELISYRDVASSANFTYGAVPNIVSRPVGKARASLVQTFREAGFRTAWLSNQEPSPFSRMADVSDFSNTSIDFHLRKDASLLPLFESFARQAGPQQFIVVHMNGSHVPYEERYSANSRVFAPTLADIGVTEPRPQHKAATINSYDNTIIEMDKFLSRVIGLLRSETRPAVLLYTSDHGENLFDDERALFMHSQATPTRYDTHVPLLIWMNQAYRAGNPTQAQAVQANAAKKISHANIFSTLLDLAMVEWDNRPADESLASMALAEKQRKIFSFTNGERDYDSLK